MNVMMYLPPIKTFTVENDMKGQAVKVLEEASELLEATKTRSRDEALLEAVDVIQATANWIAKRGYSNVEVADAFQKVTRSNEERGRYK